MRASSGSISRINENTWRVRVSCGYDPRTGKRIRKTKQIRGSKRDAERLKAEMMLDETNPINSKMTLGEFCEVYLENAKLKVRPCTYSGYVKNIRKITYSDLERLKLTDMEKHEDRVIRWLNEEDSIGAKINAYKTLRQVLNYAKKKRYITVNVMDFIEESKSEVKEKETITTEMLPAYLECIKGSKIEGGIFLMLGCGLRRSEAVGVAYDDIDFAYQKDECYGRLSIKRGCYTKQGGGVYFSDPKTPQSKREVLLPQWVGKRLEQIGQGKKWVCQELDGSVLMPDRLSKLWRKATDKAGLEPILVKNLRHSCGTILIREAGVPVSDVQQLLGHTSSRTTEKFYVQKSDVSSRRVANAMNMFNPIKNE